MYLDRVAAVIVANDYTVTIGDRKVSLPEDQRKRGSCVASYFQPHESTALREVLASKRLRDLAEPILPIFDGTLWAVDPENIQRAMELIPVAMAFTMIGVVAHPLAKDAATITVGPTWGA